MTEESEDEQINVTHTSIPLIDTSTPESLERDFYAWLQGMHPSVSEYYPTPEPKQPETVEESESPPGDILEIGKIGNDGRKNKRKASGTNLYGRPYCPGRPLSMEERTRIIELHMSGMKVNAISKSLCISHGCVSKIISRFRQTGILSPASSPEQRRSRRKKTESPLALPVPPEVEFKQMSEFQLPPHPPAPAHPYAMHMHYMTPIVPQYSLMPEHLALMPVQEYHHPLLL